jgi:hypothetical protein
LTKPAIRVYGERQLGLFDKAFSTIPVDFADGWERFRGPFGRFAVLRREVFVPASRRVSGSARPPSLQAGDDVRLKFLYPGGAVEILDCSWVAIVGLGANGSEALSQWVVIEVEGREIWKPLAYLAQAEVLQENREPATHARERFAREVGDLGYHR